MNPLLYLATSTIPPGRYWKDKDPGCITLALGSGLLRSTKRVGLGDYMDPKKPKSINEIQYQ
jgi:hypothetical protein